VIFQATINERESWRLVLEGVKTQTRRPRSNGECLYPASGNHRYAGQPPLVETPLGHIKWQVGRLYKVQPARGQQTIHYRPLMGVGSGYEAQSGQPGGNGGKQWKPLQIRITDIRREDVRQISEADAVAEGFVNSDTYLGWRANHYDHKLWKVWDEKTVDLVGWREFIAARPAYLYDAWALTFEVNHAG
jgi:hypothetical protein